MVAEAAVAGLTDESVVLIAQTLGRGLQVRVIYTQLGLIEPHTNQTHNLKKNTHETQPTDPRPRGLRRRDRPGRLGTLCLLPPPAAPRALGPALHHGRLPPRPATVPAVVPGGGRCGGRLIFVMSCFCLVLSWLLPTQNMHTHGYIYPSSRSKGPRTMQTPLLLPPLPSSANSRSSSSRPPPLSLRCSAIRADSHAS